MIRTTSSRRAAISVAVAGLLVTACGSAPADDGPDAPAETDGGANPEILDTVVPENDIGVGGGEPVDNLNPNVEPGADDLDGDGAPEDG